MNDAVNLQSVHIIKTKKSISLTGKGAGTPYRHVLSQNLLAKILPVLVIMSPTDRRPERWSYMHRVSVNVVNNVVRYVPGESSCYCNTRSALGKAHVPPTKVFQRLPVNKTILKPRVAVATGGQYVYVGFSRRYKIPRCSAYTISENRRKQSGSGIRYRAPKLINSSMSRHLSTCNISSKFVHAFLSNLANRQTNTG